MEVLKCILLFICCLGCFNLSGQVSIIADPVSGCDTVSVTFKLDPPSVAPTVTSISWSFSNGTFITGELEPVVEFNNPGLYSVMCVINLSDTIIETNMIEVRKGPVADFSYSDTIMSGSYNIAFSVLPQPVPANTYTYTWLFSDGGTENTSSFIYSFPESGNYDVQLIVTDQTGCTDEEISTINVEDIIEVPNVFSPNGDDINDYLIIRTNGLNVYSLSLYTRSGILVYRLESPSLIWDGRSHSGQPLSPGIYYYVIEKLDGEPEKGKNGFIHLIL